MVTLAVPSFGYVVEGGDAFLNLFPHRFDYIYAPHSPPGTSPHWQTESRHPLTDRMLSQGSYLYGVRFGTKTQYCLLDVDIGSSYHPQADPLAVQRMLAALEAIGLTRYLACTSSYSGGLHLYFPFQSLQNSWEIGAVVTVLLENAGFAVKPGLLEVFPNRKSFSVQGKPSLFNAHRLPLQAGSYLLNRDFEPIWSDHHTFVKHWQKVQDHNEITANSLRQILKQTQRKHYQVSGKAAKFINDLNAEIELGWTGSGQTNYLLGRITMRTYIFHHILEGGAPLEGQALVNEIVTIARSLPGYQEWCQHQHEIEHRANEWARCIENSRYFHYGDPDNKLRQLSQLRIELPKTLNWNQQQSENVRNRIKAAIADLLNQNTLPAQATARFKLLTAYGIGGSSLYRHKDLWHPEFLMDRDSTGQDQSSETSNIPSSSTSLLPPVGSNPAPHLDSSASRSECIKATDRNSSSDKASGRSDSDCAKEQLGDLSLTLITAHFWQKLPSFPQTEADVLFDKPP